jgi:hypothetical protein
LIIQQHANNSTYRTKKRSTNFVPSTWKLRLEVKIELDLAHNVALKVD